MKLEFPALVSTLLRLKPFPILLGLSLGVAGSFHAGATVNRASSLPEPKEGPRAHLAGARHRAVVALEYQWEFRESGRPPRGPYTTETKGSVGSRFCLLELWEPVTAHLEWIHKVQAGGEEGKTALR